MTAHAYRQAGPYGYAMLGLLRSHRVMHRDGGRAVASALNHRKPADDSPGI